MMSNFIVLPDTTDGQMAGQLVCQANTTDHNTSKYATHIDDIYDINYYSTNTISK